jgi:pimeloyl-ACP methyl ester carboxylesterase
MADGLHRFGVDRRTIVKSAFAAVAAAGASGATFGNVGGLSARAQTPGTTFVLVHGAWHGGWTWQRMTPMLRAAGRTVHTPTLTGLGERAHLGSRHTSLNTHIIDIVSMMQMEDLKDVVLVGHSYAGFVVTGVADRSPSRVRTLVYLDAFVPEDGKSLNDFIPPDRRPAFEKAGADKGFHDPFPLAPFGVTKPEDVAWAQPRLRPQPYLTFAQPLKLRGGAPRIPRVFIRCMAPAYPNFEPFAQRLRNDPNWKYLEVAGGHDAMISNPRGLADALLSLA